MDINFSSKNTMIVFDIDDTIFDTNYFAKISRGSAIDSMFEKYLQLKNKDEISDIKIDREILIKTFYEVYNDPKLGKNHSRQYEEVLSRLGFVDYEISCIAAAGVKAHHDSKNHIREIKFAREILELFSQNSYKLGIISSGIPIKQIDKLQRINLDLFFNPKYMDIKDCNKKPQRYRDYISKIKNMNPEIENFIMIGDKIEADCVNAINGGFDLAILLKHPRHTKEEYDKLKENKSYIVIESLEEILEILHLNQREILVNK